MLVFVAPRSEPTFTHASLRLNSWIPCGAALPNHIYQYLHRDRGDIPPAMGATGPSSMPPRSNSPISFPLAMKPLKRLKSKLLYGDPFCDITC